MPLTTGLTPTRFYARVFGLATALLLGFVLWRLLERFTASLLWAGLLAFMMHPLNGRLLARWKRPALVSGLLTGAAVVIIIGPVALFVFAFIRQATELLQRFQAEAPAASRHSGGVHSRDRAPERAAERNAPITIPRTSIHSQSISGANLR